eukprot:6172575-Pleurochrysis_carterae.AAC.3
MVDSTANALNISRVGNWRASAYVDLHSPAPPVKQRAVNPLSTYGAAFRSQSVTCATSPR